MKTILLVEDDPFIVDIYSNIFRKEGYKVDVANNGQAALEKIKNNEPDLLVLDIKLPKEKNGAPQENEGWEILKMVRSDPKTQNLKVIVTSNLNQKNYPADVANLGIIKSFLKVESTPEEITNAVKEILK